MPTSPRGGRIEIAYRTRMAAACTAAVCATVVLLAACRPPPRELAAPQLERLAALEGVFLPGDSSTRSALASPRANGTVRHADGAAHPNAWAAPQAPQRAAISTQQQAALAQVPAITLDFETGDLRGWTATGNALNTQPTFGDNSRARGAQPANQQGDFWIGTFENRPRTAREAGGAQGDRPQGTLSSTAFDVPEGSLSFLVGGGAAFETRVELWVVLDPIEGASRVAYASGENVDTMRRVTWDLRQWAGQRAQVIIVDESAVPWGHINVDDFRFSRGVLPQPQPVAVPDVLGRDGAAALKILRSAGFQGRVVDRREARQTPGSVIGQQPRGGARALPGTVVELVAAVPVTTVVPRLDGGSEADARRRLDVGELRAGRIAGEQSRSPDGTVLRQSVPAGTRVEVGTAIDMVVATPVTKTVPDLIGVQLAEARRRLEAAELAVGTVSETESRRPAGIVLTQSERAGSAVVIGTAVDLMTAIPVMVMVPDLTGRDLPEARGLLEGLELGVARVTSQESRQPAGSVLAQQPAAGAHAPINTAVDLVIAEPVTVLVPALVGFSENDALELLRGAELTAGALTRRESRQPVGTVLEQAVAAGERVVVGTTVGMVLADPVTVLVPEVVGSSEADATVAIEGAELVVGEVQYRESPAAVSTVLTQSLNPGTRVQIGSAINLLVAVVETVPVPEVVGEPIEQARRALVAGRLEVGTEELRETRGEPEGTVLQQSRAAGSVAAVGTPVNLVVATPEIIEVPSLVGLSESEAIALITGAGLVVGAVGEQLSIEAGGTVLAQTQPAGRQVVFGTPIGLQLARPRTVWAVPSALLLLLLGAATVMVARRRTARWRRVERDADDAPPLPNIHVRPITDPGRQAVEAGAEPTREGEIRLRPRLDAGVQASESPGELIAGEGSPDDE